MSRSPIVVVHGARSRADLPGLDHLCPDTEFRFAPDGDALAQALPGADVMLGWNFAAREFRDCWPLARDLRWIHWCGAGVDAVLTDELRASDVTLTNVRGLFDTAMAEYALGLVLAMAKNLPRTVRNQTARHWEHRLTEPLAGARVLVVGAGSIGRCIARMLRAVGLEVHGVARTARDADPDFTRLTGIETLDDELPAADYVVLITPLTDATRGLFDLDRFRCMAPHARFINLGRGALTVEADLVRALDDGLIAGAALDVFETEPLQAESPFWAMENVIVSPHMSGDYQGYYADMVVWFSDNLARYQREEPLVNVVDKREGFVPHAAP